MTKPNLTHPSVVYVTNKSPTHDYASATQFGSLRFVTMGNYPVFKTSRLMEEIAVTLAYSRPEDYILFSGSAVIGALVMVMWLQMHNEANMLIWDRINNRYVLRPIKASDVQLELEKALDTLKIERAK